MVVCFVTLHRNTVKDITQDLFGFLHTLKPHTHYKGNNTLYRKSAIISQKRKKRRKKNARHSNVVSLVSIRKICQTTNHLEDFEQISGKKNPWGNVPRCKFQFNFKITSVITSPAHRSTHMHTKIPFLTEGDRL